MKTLINFLGIVLIVFGIGVLAYKVYSYKTDENIIQIGDLHVTAQTEKTVYVHPMWGGLSIVAGVVLLVIGRVRKF
jgi:hypothetical protein